MSASSNGISSELASRVGDLEIQIAESNQARRSDAQAADRTNEILRADLDRTIVEMEVAHREADRLKSDVRRLTDELDLARTELVQTSSATIQSILPPTPADLSASENSQRIRELEADIEEGMVLIGRLEMLLQEKSGEAEVLSTQVAALRIELKSRSDQLTTTSEQNAGLLNELSALQSRNETLEADITRADALTSLNPVQGGEWAVERVALTSEITALRGQINDLETEVLAAYSLMEELPPPSEALLSESAKSEAKRTKPSDAPRSPSPSTIPANVSAGVIFLLFFTTLCLLTNQVEALNDLRGQLRASLSSATVLAAQVGGNHEIMVLQYMCDTDFKLARLIMQVSELESEVQTALHRAVTAEVCMAVFHKFIFSSSQSLFHFCSQK